MIPPTDSSAPIPTIKNNSKDLLTLNDGGWSFDPLDETPTVGPARAITPVDTVSNEQDQVLSLSTKNASKPAKISKASADSKPISRPSTSSLAQDPRLLSSSEMASAAQRSTPQLTSFRLSDIFESVKDYRNRDLDLKALLSQESTRTSLSVRSSAKQRGKVLDWDTQSVASNQHEDIADAEQSIVRSSFVEPRPWGSSSTNKDPIASQQSSALPQANPSAHRAQASTAASCNVLSDSAAQSAAKNTTGRSSLQDAQREESLDIDDTIKDLDRTVLGSWDLDAAMKQGVPSNTRKP